MQRNNFKSKLPNLATSIFTEMSLLANQYDAINLSQGFPEFDTPEFLKDSISNEVRSGNNQYSPSNGMPDLLKQIEALIYRRYDTTLNGLESISVTSGATEALFVAIQTIVNNGDEVIVFDPAYDSYEPAVSLAGGKCIHIPLVSPEYKINWNDVENAITASTKAIIINTPHNPTGTLLSENDLIVLSELAHKHNFYVISDEVYEFITFDGQQHESALKYPELFKRTFVISSFGKTFHCTGWKLGYCIAPKPLADEFRKIHQYVTFSSFTPAQLAVANMLETHPEHINELGAFYQKKRNLLLNALSHSRFKTFISKGTYFILLDYSDISDLSDKDFCHWLTKEVGVAAIPLSPFYEGDYDEKIIRLCFAKNDETLLKAASILCKL
ncbi:methionine aminotransferase [Pseudoalteromonas denitrificans]|uniref:2-keto-4-methylthiobutyrate aminotransferase apoenzyme n=1 Tax=Pseudoalteromonas denitrificans DSM 6059 TaxID=1123010 RepID=A0A1I1RFX9_9GAMM|nr:methionine aminotransferase [Pseudoalteromonas denitrificans]SFD33296.1 2-keto-4-methylthiobutyrate aminotransferase apoenzyme [Pseudoalteromonas denitrificans DSM 6059]